MDTPQSRLDGKTPRETILEERAEQPLLPEDEDTSEDEQMNSDYDELFLL